MGKLALVIALLIPVAYAQYFPPSGGGGGGGATIPSTTNLIKGDGSGNGANSKVAVTSPATAATIQFSADNETVVLPDGTMVPNSRTVCGQALSSNIASCLSGLGTNKLQKATGATTIGDSSISDDGTTVSTTEKLSAGSFQGGVSPPSITGGSGIFFTEAAAPSIGLPASGVDGCYADSTAHAILCSFNNGTAAAVYLVGGALGTPASGTLTNATGLPISTGVSGLGSNVAAFLATPSGPNFNSMISAGGIPVTQNSQSTAYTTVLADGGKQILHPTADNNPRTFTIDSNANVAYPIGTTITFVNQINTLSIAITSDTMTLAGTASTGTRTLAANGMATALKIGTTAWLISGPGTT